MPGWNEAAWFSFLTGVALKSIAVLGAAWLVTLFLRGRSAAARHLVWMAAFGGLLALPLLTVAVPALPVPGTGAILAPQIVFHTDASAGVQIGGPLDFQAKAGQGAARRPGGLPHLDWRAALMLAWAVGASALLLQMLAGLAYMQRLRLRARTMPDDLSALAAELGIRHAVDALETAPGRMPMSFGMLRPAVFMPADSATWSEERRRVVLLHELAHVRRRDHAKHLMARAALCAYWWNPLALLAWRAFLKERERATDDLVLAAGARASDYAAHLLEIARTMRSAPALGAAAVAVARRSQLEGRLLAILDSARNRKSPSRTAALATTLLCAALVIPLAALRAQQSPQALPVDIAAPSRPLHAQAAPAETDHEVASALGASPANGARLIALGVDALGSKLYDEAFEYFQRAQLGSPAKAAEAAMWQAVVRERQSRDADADSLYRMAINLAAPDSPEQATIMELYAKALQRLNQPDQAAEMRAKAAKIRAAAPPAPPVFPKAPMQKQGAPVGETIVTSQANREPANLPTPFGTSTGQGNAAALPPAPPPPPPPSSQSGTLDGVAVRGYSAAAGATLPRVIRKVEPAYSDEARAARFQGTVVLHAEVGPDGKAHDISVQRHLGLGLDEKAVEAVSQWLFQPAMKDGQPVTASVTLEVNFRLGDQTFPNQAGPDSGVFRVGGGVTAPALLSKIEPEYTVQARYAGYEGTVVLYAEIGTDGVPQKIQVMRGLGLGLDGKAVEAVSKWRFQPGTRFGVPVTVAATIEVNFRLL